MKQLPQSLLGELFLDHAQQLKEPLFYQHITDEVFETLVKETVNVPEAGP